MVEQDPAIGDDGLTNEEREFLQTPVSQVAQEQRKILVALRDKKAAYICAENEKYRQVQEEKFKANLYPEIK